MRAGGRYVNFIMIFAESLPPAVIFGSGHAGLSAVQSLGTHGMACWVCHSQRSIASHSRYARYWHVPNPQDDEQGFIKRVVALIERLGRRPVLMPAGDQYAQAIARHRFVLKPLAELCVAPSSVIDRLVDKAQFAEWARLRRFSCPRTICAAECDAVPPLAFPLVAKRRYPVWSNATKSRMPSSEALRPFTFQLIEDIDQWESLRVQAGAYLPYILLQEFIPGTTAEMYSVGVYVDQNSQIKSRFVGRKIRGFPAMFGNACAGQNDVVPEYVLSEVHEIIADLRYQGIAEFDYKRNVLTGSFHLLEINPRCWSWMGITSATPADIPWVAYQDLIGREVTEAYYDATPGTLKYVQIMPDFRNVMVRYQWDFPQWTASPIQWWKTLQAERLVIAELSRRDWPVMVCSVLKGIRRLLLSPVRLIGSLFRLRKQSSAQRSSRGVTEGV